MHRFSDGFSQQKPPSAPRDGCYGLIFTVLASETAWPERFALGVGGRDVFTWRCMDVDATNEREAALRLPWMPRQSRAAAGLRARGGAVLQPL